MSLGHVDEHWGSLKGQLRTTALSEEQGSDFAEQLGFHLAPYTNNKTIAIGSSLLPKAGYLKK